ncbi:MAG: ATP-dependent helicase, partial [Variovorax sp.]|nr:ATP-dependent helicase [Variovorax sp.]
SYAGLRALMVPPSKRSSALSRRRHRAPLFGIEDAGRWTLIRQPSAAKAAAAPSTAPTADAVEQVARVLLRRYGVVCWRMLEREAQWLPSWRELVRSLRRLEARGEIRGGRFIAGLSGEQFALPEAIALMRSVRRQPADPSDPSDMRYICLSASDPANLLGTVLTGPKVPRVAGARVLYRDGVPVATSVGGQTEWLVELAAGDRPAALHALALEAAPYRVGFRPGLGLPAEMR